MQKEDGSIGCHVIIHRAAAAACADGEAKAYGPRTVVRPIVEFLQHDIGPRATTAETAEVVELDGVAETEGLDTLT